jgi:hypothetical protein
VKNPAYVFINFNQGALMADMLDTLLKNGSSPFARTINDSFIQENTGKTFDTGIPMLNTAFSGKMNVGFQSGITVFAGPSKHFKSMYALTMLDSYFKDNPEGIGLIMDSEYGITEDYLNQFPNIAQNLHRIIHIPVTTLEEMRHELTLKVEGLYEEYKAAYKKSKNTEKPNVFILIDSIGQVASKKETLDAVDGKDKADMTRAKITKSIFRIVTSKVKMLGIPCAVVAHTYDTMDLFPKKVVSGGCVIEGTKIIMADGTLKEIQNIIVGDTVKTKDGPKEVINTWDKNTLENPFPECYEVTFEDGNTYTMSADHKLMVNGQWVKTKDFKVGMDIDTFM